ncbi:glutamate--cysteine ligase [Aeromicrobium halocynthiae]|uniref:Putative glutamate--cysteine ligase 2 n=1 Tax=Aeromicrobium halocynthiae TaxID=560557 RepID=A0ABP5HIT1_9ACTN
MSAARRTVGIEEEMFLVDPATHAVVPRSGGAVTAEGRDGDADDLVEQEMFLEQVETTTEPCEVLEDLRRAARTSRTHALRDAEEVGATLMASSTVVLGPAGRLVPDDRYATMVERHRSIAEEVVVNGMHVHVGVDCAEEGVRVLDRMAVWLPVLQALSAASPVEHGVDTGFASWRAERWERWPTAGPAQPFGTPEAYEAMVADLVESGAAVDDGMVYLDARLGRGLPTVEVRVADVQADLDDAVVLAGLTRALVATCAETTTPVQRVETLRVARWRARRYGLTDRLLDPSTARLRPAADVVANLLELVRPALEEAGDVEIVDDAVRGWAATGGHARRLREVAARSPETLPARLSQVTVQGLDGVVSGS